MQAEKKVSFLLIGSLCLSFCLAAGQEDNRKQKAGQKERESLIRKELLYRGRRELKPPKRNIFSAQSSGVGDEHLETLGVPQGLQPNESTVEASSSTLTLRYIGYIDSDQRIVALIIFEGQAVAVEEGERISEQYTVGKITTKKLEVIGPGNEIENFSLEGDEG